MIGVRTVRYDPGYLGEFAARDVAQYFRLRDDYVRPIRAETKMPDCIGPGPYGAGAISVIAPGKVLSVELIHERDVLKARKCCLVLSAKWVDQHYKCSGRRIASLGAIGGWILRHKQIAGSSRRGSS